MSHEMIYVRPQTLSEAVAIHDNAAGVVRVVSGGAFDRSGLQDADLLLDLQDVKPSDVSDESQFVLGPADTVADLQQMLFQFVDFDRAATAEAGLNVRNTLSLYNFLRIADGRSPVLVALRALNTVVRWQPSHQFMCLEEYLYTRNQDRPGFWSELIIEKPSDFGYESVARTPLDKPVAAVAISTLKNQKLRVAIGGHVSLLEAVELPPTGDGGHDWVMRTTENLNDAWGSGLYRQNTAVILFDRLMQRMTDKKDRGAI